MVGRLNETALAIAAIVMRPREAVSAVAFLTTALIARYRLCASLEKLPAAVHNSTAAMHCGPTLKRYNRPSSYEVGLLLGSGGWSLGDQVRGSAAAGTVAKADNHRADNGPTSRKTAARAAASGMAIRRKSLLRR